MLMRGSTNEAIAVLLGEKTPSPPCAIGRVASVWAYFGSASLLGAVWRTEHVSCSIWSTKGDLQLCVLLGSSRVANVLTSDATWNGKRWRMLSV
eukprot:15006134-Ditylum_brightwellii.AAC.1